jgi:hypothetical protein
VLRFLFAANVVPSSLILSTLMIKAICFSETSILTRVTRRHIPENGILLFTEDISNPQNNLKKFKTTNLNVTLGTRFKTFVCALLITAFCVLTPRSFVCGHQRFGKLGCKRRVAVVTTNVFLPP